MNALRRLAVAGVVSLCVLLGGLVFGSVGALAALRYPFLGQIDAAGVPGGSFEEIYGVAADSGAGSVLVNDYKNLYEFGSLGGYEAALSGPGSPFRALGVATNDGTGNVYVTDDGNGVVDVFDGTGGYLSQFTGTGVPGGLGDPSAVAVDQANGDVYVFSHVSRAIDVSALPVCTCHRSQARMGWNSVKCPAWPWMA